MRRFVKLSICGVVLALGACEPAEPEVKGAPPDMRRLTEAQYQNVIADVFGIDVEVAGRFDPLLRTQGLVALGAREARITPTGFERFFNIARTVADRVTDEQHRHTLIPCAPKTLSAADDDCARAFLTQSGRLLFRRALTTTEADYFVKAANDAAVAHGDFYHGIATSLTSMLVTPQFLFVADTTETDPSDKAKERLTGAARASRLSFFLWNTSPDELLLSAAERGELDTADGVERHIDRLLTSPRATHGVRAFFTDFLALEDFETLEKDPVIYPTFTLDVAENAREQILRTIVHHLMIDGQDYRDLFTTRKTFLTRSLARLYRVPIDRTDNGWVPFEFTEAQARVGIQSQIALMALYAYPGRSSAVRRGRAVRELLMCQKVPDPPGDVDFSGFLDADSPKKTARERLIAHRTAPACEGCHKITDPIGLAFENFDGAGQFRTTENDAPIDASGDLNGLAYTGPVGLGQALRGDPAVASCAVNRLFSYAVGRAVSRDEAAVVKYLDKSFAAGRYNFPALMRRIASSDAFFAVSKPPVAAAAATPTETTLAGLGAVAIRE